MLPRLQAENRIIEVRNALVALPEYPGESRKEELDELIATAKGEEIEKPKVTKEQARVVMASMGIKFVEG